MNVHCTVFPWSERLCDLDDAGDLQRGHRKPIEKHSKRVNSRKFFIQRPIVRGYAGLNVSIPQDYSMKSFSEYGIP